MNERATPTSTAAAVAETDLARLEKMVQLSTKPTAVSYRRRVMGTPGLGPTDWSVVVLLTYASPADATAALAGARVVPSRPQLDDETWIPEAIRAAIPGQAKAYRAEAFFKSPLNAGSAFHVEGATWVVVVVHTT